MGSEITKILSVFLSAVASLTAGGAYAETPAENWLRTYVFLDSTGTVSRARETKVYYDGMGREVLAVAGATSLPDAYTATRTDYAIHGPIARKWLPVPSDAEYVNKNAYASKSAAFYGAGERAFTEYTYSELLPTRLSKETIPGNFWAGHGQKYSQHKCALTGEYACRKILVKDSDGTLYADSIYAPGTLRVTETENPDGMRLLKFENRQEKTVMERRIAGSTVADTRYVYDRRGDLRYVISPEGAALLPQSGDVDSEITEQYAQCYTYDYKHRAIKSKLPGCGATEYVYDKFGKLLMSADALQQQRHEWTVTLYDWKMRPAVRGTMTVPGLNAGALRETFRDSTLTATFSPTENDIETGLLYSPDAALNGFTPFMAWYYDNYDFIIGPNSVCRTRYADRSDGFTATGLQTGMAQNSGDGTVIYTAQKFDGYGNVTLSGN